MRKIIFFAIMVIFILSIICMRGGVLRTKQVDIFMICNEKYAPYTAAAIQSIEKNKSFWTQNNFYLATTDDVEKVKLYFNDKLKKKITFISVSDFFKGKYGEELLNVYNTRFFASEMFPNLDKILYLDSDIFVFKDLSLLYSEDIQTVYAGVVSDIPSSIKRRKDVLGIKTYFNAGVMLLNLKKMRDDNVLEQLIKNYDLLDKEGKLLWADQDVLNYTFKENVRFLPEKYNQQGLALTKEKDDATYILHYTSFKPWKDYPVPYYFTWWENFEKTHLAHYEKQPDKSVFLEDYKKVNDRFIRVKNKDFFK